MRTRYPRQISAVGRHLFSGLLTGFLLAAGPLLAQPTAGRPAAPPATDLLLALRNAPPAADRQRVLREKLQLTAADEMRLLRTETDELGFVHERFQPYYRGVKVEHASISLHERGGRIETLSGTYVHPAAGLSARPALTEAAALQRALAAVGARRYKWQEPGEEAALKQQTGNPAATYQPHGELVWVGDFRQPEATRPVVLAWKYNIYAAEPVSRAYVYVDAQTGQEVFRNAIIKHVNAPGAQFATRYVGARTSITDNTGSGYRLRETATGKGVTTLNLRKSETITSAFDFIDNDNNWTAAEHNNANKDNAALDAHLGAQATQGYWNTVHGRDSYDDRGTVLLSYVHYGNNIDNAFWNGTAMLYGDGNTLFKPLTSIDVCAHEVGHAVMDATANLTYQNESGAMNEGFSDIWGCAVEHHFDPAKQKYLIGEDITLPSFGTALRSMSNPNAHDQPDTYLGTLWATGSGDFGGVHTNSGVLNFWFYLLSNGGSGTNDKGTAFNVTGITIEKAEKIAYRTQRIYLTASSNYAAGRKASMQAAIDLYGLGSAEVQSTAQAWRAVGVGTATGVAEAAPTITGFTPTSGLAGTVVTITGTNLGATMRVTFNGADATIATLTSSTSLTVTVPPGASTGLISLSTAAGTATTGALSPANFTITAAGPAPVITGFSPAGGQVQGGAVTITGTALTGATAVRFNGVAATILTNTATTITTTVPAGATSGPLTVTTANGTATAPTTFAVLPFIASFTPTASAVGVSVVLTGTTLTGALDVKFNGVYATYTVNSATQITVTVPNGATTGPITVRTPSGTATSATNFTVNPTLAFSNFSPISGPVITTVVNIRGRGFTNTSAITFGGVNAPTFTVASDLELFVTVPVGAITGNIVLITPLGPATSPAAFTVTAPLVPTITSFTPASGVVGDAVTITGTNFTGATAVTFNGTAATFTVVNSTTIFTSVPVGATTGVIRVTVPGGTATSATTYSVVLPGAPAITSFTPANGNTGTVVTLTGTNFTGTTAVAFNGTAAAFTLVSSTSITTTAPAGGTTGQISVTNGFGTGLSATAFFYPPTNDLCANTGLPVLACGGSVSGTTTSSTSTGDPTGTCGTSVQATAGGVFYRFVGTGGSVTLSTCAAGTNYDTKLFVFTGTCGSYTCVGGNDDITCGVISTASAVTFTSVAGTNYFVFVSGFNSNQGNFTLTTNCVPVTPTISSFTPTSGLVGTSVDLTGTNFTAASGVTFNGTAATTFTVNSATSITATVPTGATTGPIGVATTSGGSGVSASNFTVIPAPTLTSLTPNSGLVGASITLTGTDFTGATGVSFNGTAAVTFNVTNATTATATVPAGATSGNVTITTPGGTSNGLAFTVLGPPVITALNPARNLHNAARASNVVVTFDQPMSSSVASAGAVNVFSQQRGGRMRGTQGGTASVSGNTIILNPTSDLKPGETVLVTTTTAAQSSAGGNMARGHVHQFTTATGGTGVGIFGTATSVSGGNVTSHLATGDLNGDGRSDLLWTNYGTTTVGVALATGPTTYAPATSVTVAGNPITIALADFDGDRDLDFVTANYGNPAGTGSNLSVGLNGSAGTFVVSTVTTAAAPRWVTPADMDGDGDLDLLVPVASGVQIYANNGNGAFALLNTVSGINFAIAALGADVDGDGNIDLLTSNYFQSNTVSVRLNDGTGTFSGSQQVAVGTQPFHLAVGDVDGDGDLDFVTANQGAGTASVRLNTGGTFAPPAIAANGEVATGAGTSIVALGDVDADGDLDMVASGNSGAVLRLNDGNGVFSAPASSGPLAGGFVALTDMDDDGDLDLATATGGATVSVRLNQGPTPTLTSLTPNSGLVGASITLTGTSFTGATGVSFNGTAAVTFSVTNATTATATVPVGATSGNVTITTPSGTSNGVAFTVITNQAPTAIGLSPQSVAENTPGGTAIGNFSTTDPDAGNTFTYTLVFGTGSADNSAFSISGSQLVITSAPDFETKSSYAIRVRTTDQGSLFFEQTFIITVTNVNEAPGAVTDANGATNTVAENAANTTAVGITATATDPDAGASLSYSLTDNAGGRFTINSSSGVVTVANGSLLDFEAATSHSITVQVSDGSLTSSQSFTITVTNVNEAPGISPQTFSTAENVPNGNLVGLVAASDPDASTTLTYLITAGNTGGAFSFNASTNQLQVANSAAINFETNPTFSLTVQVSDGSLTSSATVTVNLTNANEAPSISPQTFAVDENSAASTVVGTVAASDPDAGTSLTYSIIGGNTGAAFTFVGNQLRVQFSGTLDFETLPTYSLTVRVTDGSLFSNSTVTVNLNDLSEAPTAIDLSGQSVPENTPAGTSFGSLSTTGPGSGYTYALVSGAGSSGNASFTIVGDLLQTAAVFDFETQNSYAIRIRSTDTGNGGEFLEQTFTISVTNLNDAPTALGLSPQSVAENTPGGSAVGNFSTTDADAGNTHTYSLVSGAGSTDNGALSISGNQLLITASPDFETQASYAIRVRTTDQFGLTFEQPFTITVTNENEAPILTIHGRSIPENSLLSAPVGAPIPATDPDAGTTLTYSITAGNTGGAFSFSGNQLQVANAAALDFETTPTFSLTVQVSDGSLAASNTVTVNLTNVNEAPTALTLSNASIAENTGANVVVGQLITTDPDAANTFTYTLVSGSGSTDNALVNLNGDEVRITASPDFETKASYAVRVRTTDQGGLAFERAFTLTITDVFESPANDAPANIFLSNANVAENAANATVGLLTTADGDVADTHTYTLVTGTGSTGNAAFTIVGSELRTAAALDFEAQASYSVRIRTTDNGTGNLFFEKAFTISVTDAAEPLTVSTVAAVPGGFYSTLTVTGTGVATLIGAVTVTTAVIVQPGGRLNTNCQPLTGPGSFTLAAGATLAICHPQGISLSGATGAVQVTGARSFASDATYVYNGTGAQITGNALPNPVRELEAANPTSVTLSQAAAVTHVLRLSSGTLNTNDLSLTLRSTATRTAYAVHAGGLTSGNVTVQRYIGGPTAAGYRHLSSPVQNTPVADLTTAGYTSLVNPAYNNLPYVAPSAAQFPNIFGFDEARGGVTPAYAGFGTGYFSPTTTGATLTSGRGWSVFMPGAQTPDFVGALTTGNVPVNLTVTGTNTSPNQQKAGWHLLGNLYPQPIDWDLATVPAGMSSSISVFRTQGGNNGQYLTRANGLGSLPNGEIALGQGFFARATVHNTVFTFTNALRVEANPATVARPVVDARPVIRLTLQATAPDAVVDETVIYAETGATTGEDNRFDGLRPGRNTGNVPTLATVIAGQEAAVNGLPLESLTTGTTTVELTAALPTAGTYTLTAADVANLPAGTTVSILDRKLNVTQPLTAGTAYQLTASAAGEVVAGRFALVFNANRVTGTHSSFLIPHSSLTIAPNPVAMGGALRVTGVAGGTPLTLFDATGRAVATISADGTGTVVVSTKGLATGVYVLRALDGRTTRLMIE